MTVSLNPAITFGNNSRRKPHAKVKGNTAVLSKTAGRQTKYVKSSFVKDASRMVMGLAMGATALLGFSRCTPEDITLPKKVLTEDTIPKVPKGVDTTAVVVTPATIPGPMSDPKLTQIARDIKEAYGVLPAFDTTKVETKGALQRIETLEEASGYYVSRKFDYSDDPMRATVTDVITDRDNPAKIDTLDVVKQTWVHGETEPKSINVPEIFQKEGSGWHKSGSTEVNKIEGKTLVRYADGKAITQLIGETPTQLNCKYIPQKAEGKIKIISTEFAELNKGVTTGLITPRAIKRIIR